jgi:uncharacterized protein with PQ loop repeat
VSVVEYFGWQASVLGIGMALAPLLQARHILARGRAGDVSEPFLWIIVVGASAWAAYGLVKPDWFVAIPNLLGVLTNLTTVMLVRRYRHRSPGHPDDIRASTAPGRGRP